MKYLLDTHAYLWWLGSPTRLSAGALEAVGDKAATVFVSMVTFWELAVKSSLGKLALSCGVEQLESELGLDGMVLLPIKIRHCGTVSNLPFHHRDPFDRLLVAQTMVEGLSLVSRDAQLDSYGISRVW